jgi:dihydrofolate synthase / folylpolyglutamate synthase
VDYPSSVSYLYALGNEVKSIKLGLDRVRAVLVRLGHPERACQFVHVAGTNGKGSTCAMIESALRHAGVRTGLYTSPHLVDPTERVRIAGEQVTPAAFSDAFDELHACAERMMAAGEIDMHPTYFESLTLMAFLLFRQHKAETVVLETGLGGRLDATNVVTPRLSVITPIDIDHTQWLGETIEKIAFEKAGIIKPGKPVVTAKQYAGAYQPIANAAAAHGSRLVRAADTEITELDLHAHGHRYRLGDLAIECRLAGPHQVENSRTAAVALRELGLAAQDIAGGIRTAQWPGRLECVAQQPEILLDGAHNVAGAMALADHLRRFYRHRRIWMVFGVMRDKQVEMIGELLFPLVTELILTAPNQGRAMPPQEIAALDCARGARVIPTVPAALEAVRQAEPEDVVVITGSLYVVGEARPLLVH